MIPIERLALYASAPHRCGYLPEACAVSLFVDPEAPLERALYSALVDEGFRRSGRYVYRPHCPHCAACVPVRIPVDAFTPGRTMRRTWRANADLQVTAVAPVFSAEHYDLYRRYVHARHGGGAMDHDDPERYLDFLSSPWGETHFYEFRCAADLMAVAVVDYLEHGLSAVYTFFDPNEMQRGLGTYAVLWQIDTARRLGLPFVYLGYWVRDCRKMHYKTRFRPHEVYVEGRWKRVETAP